MDKANAPGRTKTFETLASKYTDAERNALADLLGELVWLMAAICVAVLALILCVVLFFGVKGLAQAVKEAWRE